MAAIFIRSQDKERIYTFGTKNQVIGYVEKSVLRTQANEIELNFEGEKMAERFGVLKSEGGKLISVKTQRVVCISINGITDTLGTYKSKERCIEIIEEIFKLCGSYIYSSGSSGYIKGELPYPPMAADIPRIYQMPEE